MLFSKIVMPVGLACLAFGAGATVTFAAPLPDPSTSEPDVETRSPDTPVIESPGPAATPDTAQAEPLQCPPGQFPSAFSDVYPFHWAYTAVNNLTSERMQCFDLPDEYR